MTLLGLAALDERAEPNYDRGTAEQPGGHGRACRRHDAGRAGRMGGPEGPLAQRVTRPMPRANLPHSRSTTWWLLNRGTVKDAERELDSGEVSGE